MRETEAQPQAQGKSKLHVRAHKSNFSVNENCKHGKYSNAASVCVCVDF